MKVVQDNNKQRLELNDNKFPPKNPRPSLQHFLQGLINNYLSNKKRPNGQRPTNRDLLKV